MIESDTPESPKTSGKKAFALPSWKSITDFVGTVFDLRRSVASLTESNKSLREDLNRLQRQSDDQAGQLKVLINFVHTSLNEQVDRRAAQTAADIVGQIMTFEQDAPKKLQRPSRKKR